MQGRCSPTGITEPGENDGLFCAPDEGPEDEEKARLNMDLAQSRGREAALFVEVQRLTGELKQAELRERNGAAREVELRAELAGARCCCESFLTAPTQKATAGARPVQLSRSKRSVGVPEPLVSGEWL